MPDSVGTNGEGSSRGPPDDLYEHKGNRTFFFCVPSTCRCLRSWSAWRRCARSGQWRGASWTRAASAWCRPTPTRCSASAPSCARRGCTRSAWRGCSTCKVRGRVRACVGARREGHKTNAARVCVCEGSDERPGSKCVWRMCLALSVVGLLSRLQPQGVLLAAPPGSSSTSSSAPASPV